LLSNRRISARKALRAPATMVLPGGVSRDLRLYDLATDGASFVASKPIPQGTRVELSFDLPVPQGTARIAASARVVYSSYAGPAEFRIGVVFAGLDEAGAQALAEFLV
jgi:hypothetical protein